MQGSWNNGRAHYRCRFPSEYALANTLQHPLAVYLREDVIVPPLDAWLAGVFAPGRVDEALAALENSQPDIDPATEAARREIAECDRKLARHRAALEAGADPELVASWSSEVQRQRANATARRSTAQVPAGVGRLTKAEIKNIVDAFGGLLSVLHSADPTDKAEVYRQLGVTLTYRYEDRTALAEVRPSAPMYAVVVSEGGLEPPRPLKGTSTSS